jgi:hypothetical protein
MRKNKATIINKQTNNNTITAVSKSTPTQSFTLGTVITDSNSNYSLTITLPQEMVTSYGQGACGTNNCANVCRVWYDFIATYQGGQTTISSLIAIPRCGIPGLRPPMVL